MYSLLFNNDSLGEAFFQLPEMKSVQQFLKSSAHGYHITGNTNIDIQKDVKKLFVSEGIQRLQLLLGILKRLTESDELERISKIVVPLQRNEKQRERINTIIQYIYNNFREEITNTVRRDRKEVTQSTLKLKSSIIAMNEFLIQDSLVRL